jgi:MFS family permease
VIPEPIPEQSVWRNLSFVRLWVAQAVTQTAQNAIWYGLLVLVERLSHSTTQLGITILSVVVPSIVFGVPAGVYVDRWDKRKVLIVTNLLRGAIVATYVAADPDTVLGSFVPIGSVLAFLYIVSFAFSIVGQFFGPAELSMIPAVVGRKGLMQATSLFHLTFTASQLVGLIFLGPLVVKLLGTTSFFLVAAGLYILCGLLVWALPPQPPEPALAEQAKRNAVRAVVEDLREVGQLMLLDPIMLWSMMYWTVGVGLTLMVAMVGPRFVVDVLGIAAEDTVYILGPGVAGTLLAAGILSRGTPGTWTQRHILIMRGLVIVGVALALVGIIPAGARALGLMLPEGTPVHVLTPTDLAVIGGVMCATFAGGIGFTAVMIGAQTSLQERAPADARGRVFAVQLMLGNLCSVVPLIGFGAIADLVGVRWVMPALGLLVLVIAMVGRRYAPSEPEGLAVRA